MVISKSKSDMVNNNYIYNSGWQNSSVSSNVKSLDLHLLPNTLYYWKVQTRDNVGIESLFSEIAVFSTGLFDCQVTALAPFSLKNCGDNDYFIDLGKEIVGVFLFPSIIQQMHHSLSLFEVVKH